MRKASRLGKRNSLSRDQIIEAAISILDESGKGGLTFQALATRLATGAGAIYWHVENKDDLLISACDVVIQRTLHSVVERPTPEETIRAVGLALFDCIDTHPWMGTVLAQTPGKMPMVRILELIGQQVRVIGVVEEWAAVSALLSYILGVAGQNAANAQFARKHGLDRSRFLGEVADVWACLDATAFPFVSSISCKLAEHDDRADFLAGIDLLIRAMLPVKR